MPGFRLSFILMTVPHIYGEQLLLIKISNLERMRGHYYNWRLRLTPSSVFCAKAPTHCVTLHRQHLTSWRYWMKMNYPHSPQWAIIEEMSFLSYTPVGNGHMASPTDTSPAIKRVSTTPDFWCRRAKTLVDGNQPAWNDNYLPTSQYETRVKANHAYIIFTSYP